jgi:hypothetical protein
LLIGCKGHLIIEKATGKSTSSSSSRDESEGEECEGEESEVEEAGAAMAAMKVKKALEEREGVQRCNCLMTDFFPEKFNKLTLTQHIKDIKLFVYNKHQYPYGNGKGF